MAVKVIFLVEVLIAAFVLWLGVYIITRDLPWRHESARPWWRPPLLAGAGLILASVYLYGTAMETVSVQQEEFLRWQRVTLWGIPIAIVCFFWAIVLLTCSGRESPPWTRALLPVSVFIAGFLAIGIAGGALLDVEGIRPGGTIFQPYYTPMSEPFNYIYYGFLASGILGCLAVLIHRLPKAAHDPARRRKIVLGIVSGLFLFAGAVTTLILAQLGNPYLPKQIGDFTATIGAAFISYDIARHNALNHE